MKLFNKICSIGIYLLFFLLVFKNPYSSRNLVGNMEPFPDSQFYTTTTNCFIKTGEWKVCRLNNSDLPGTKSTVPPFYSISLLPFLLVNQDPRTIFFANLTLSFISLILFRKVTDQLFKNKFITNTTSLLLITNYFFYWPPTLAMAENLLLPAVIFAFYLLIQNTSRKNIILAGLLAVGFYGIKYALVPLTLTFGLTYLLKIIIEHWKNKKEILVNVTIYFISGSVLAPFLLDIKQLFLYSKSMADQDNPDVIVHRAFSATYLKDNLPEYIKPLLGKSQRFLWDYTPLIPQWLSKLSILGLAISFFEKKNRLIGFFLVSSITLQIIFMSTFYTVDARYVYNLLPSLLIGFGFLLDLIRKKLVFTLPFIKEAKCNYTFYFTTLLLLAYYLISVAIPVKKQIGLNLKFTETPWWKVSVDEYNSFFKEENNNYLIALHSPLFFDYYSNQNYQPLPLNYQQDFFFAAKKIWGDYDYSNLIDLYKSKMENNNVYVTNYGINANNAFEEAFKEIKVNFNLVQVHDGCHHLCNIYQLQPLEITESNSSN